MRAASGVLWAALLSCGLCGPAAADMVANTSVRPPYQFLHDGELSGTTIDTLRCIQQAQATHWDIVLVPWARALHNFSEGRAQLLFPVYRAPENGQLTAPIAIERWQWVSRNQDQGARIGAVRGSNEHLWLNAHGKSPSMLVSSEHQLLKLLQQKRIDRFIADAHSLDYLAAKHRVSTETWQRRFLRFVPLFMAVHQKASSAPETFQHINHLTGQCARNSMQLTSAEQQVALSFVRQLQPEINQLVRAHLANSLQVPITVGQLSEREASWRALPFEDNPHIIQSLSAQLLDLQHRHVEIGEIIVMGARGETLAAAQKTTDYWQGDEDKFLQAAQLSADDMWIDAIHYDESSHRFIAHLAWPHYQAGALAGVISVGLKMELLLAK